MNNEIADRIAFFLKDFPPFHYLDYPELEALATQVTVRFLEETETLFQEGQSGHDCCYVLRKGNIKLTHVENGKDTLVDQCEPGDIFGVRSILTGNKYVMTAYCEEESLAYEIPKDLFLYHISSNQRFSFFFTSGYAAGHAIAGKGKQELQSQFGGGEQEQTVQYTKDVLTCDKKLPIKKAALQMKERRAGSIIIEENNLPIGIVTDTDFRNKVVANEIPVSAPIETIMSAPVKSIQPHFTFSEVLIKMMRSKTHHLLVTEDGSPNSPVRGMISDHDLMISQNNHPSALIKQLRKEENPEKWPGLRNQAEMIVADYLDKGLSVELVSNFITEMNDTLITKAIEDALEKVPEAKKIDFAWLSLGSEGREEQLLRTDQDNAIVYSDTHTNAQGTLVLLAGIINETLDACGFEKCPADIMARNPAYNQTLTGWKETFGQWISHPDQQALLNATIFFDFREVYGNGKLTQSLRHFLSEHITHKRIFLNHLAANALQNPAPLSFFKNFLVEKSGEHVDQFDIKKRAMMPLSDIARLLCLQYTAVDVQNTPDRYQKLAQLDTNNKELYEQAAQSYRMMMRIRAKYGLKNNDSGRYIDISEMNKLEKQILRSAFAPIKELQEMVETRFQLAYFR